MDQMALTVMQVACFTVFDMPEKTIHSNDDEEN